MVIGGKQLVHRHRGAREREIESLRVNPGWAKLPLFGRSKWPRVHFGEVVENVSETVSSPADARIEKFIGLEHLEPGSLHIREWGNVADGTTFTRRCRLGQVLFGKRRAYQRKVVVAEFDAVVSGDIYVLAPKGDRLLPELLPFLCLSERFFQHAVGTSAGSLSPRTNWSSLASFEFDLPPLDQQRSIAEILWAVDEVAEKWTVASHHVQTLLKEQVDEVFRGSGSSKWAILDDLTTKIVDGVHKTPNYKNAGVPFIVVENLTSGRKIDFTNTRFISEADHKDFCRRAKPERGDVLVSKDGTLGVTRYVDSDCEFSIFVSVALLKPKRELLDGRLLAYYMRSSLFWEHVRKTSAGSALKHIVLRDFKSAPFPVTPLNVQQQHVETLERIAEGTDEVFAHVTRSKALLQSMINEWIQP
jgi:restriction endonuclease S subunit